ncbi:hypothetical protein [Hymenobacter algoricola]|uniref:AbiV family abortive infection protein n=1 Tax=Hymenobacter algoricola TaxID=486267 RepID=A0ABP7NIJ1_9BACT
MEIISELSEGIIKLLSNKLNYAASALLRQLVETQYLLFLFSKEINEASKWLDSDSEQIRKYFNPSLMRKRCDGKFRNEEYWKHCEIGGHPNPAGRKVLKNHFNLLDMNKLLWADFALHLKESAIYIIDIFNNNQTIFQNFIDNELILKIEKWENEDPLSKRIAMSL